MVANDDDGSSELSSLLNFTAQQAGTYYILVSGFGPSARPENPFDSSSGAGFGSEGSCDLLISIAKPDADVYSFNLWAGVAPKAGRYHLAMAGGEGIYGATVGVYSSGL